MGHAVARVWGCGCGAGSSTVVGLAVAQVCRVAVAQIVCRVAVAQACTVAGALVKSLRMYTRMRNSGFRGEGVDTGAVQRGQENVKAMEDKHAM